MKKIKLKSYAKVNLTLDILGTNENFHTIKSLVCSVDICDEITLTKRKDKQVTLATKGLEIDCKPTSNNAFKSAKLFIDKFKTCGVDIVINKKIPIGAGLGGSSADVAGVLNGMQALYPGKHDIEELANRLGSDCAYMLKGGFATIEGRGEKVTNKNIDCTLYFIILTSDTGISAKASYLEFDKINKYSDGVTDKAISYLTKGEYDKFSECIKNDLYEPSSNLLPEIASNYYTLKLAGAKAQIMTGSGSAVCGIFFDKKERDKAYKKLLPLYKDKVLKAKTI